MDEYTRLGLTEAQAEHCRRLDIPPFVIASALSINAFDNLGIVIPPTPSACRDDDITPDDDGDDGDDGAPS